MSDDPTDDLSRRGASRAPPPAPTRPRACKRVRLRPGTRGRDVTTKARHVRAFLARGHCVAVEHLARRDAPLDLDALAAHYEQIAEALQGLPWTSSGPFLLAGDHALVLLLPVR